MKRLSQEREKEIRGNLEAVGKDNGAAYPYVQELMEEIDALKIELHSAREQASMRY